MAYAVIQLGQCVFGAGQTREDALADARQYVPDPDTLEADIEEYLPGRTMDGAVICVECSEALAAEFAEQGAVTFEMDGRIAVLPDDDDAR